MVDLKKFVVMHDYGTEGWKIFAQVDTILEAVKARESDLANGGGTSVICEVREIFDAYRLAGYEQDELDREALKMKGTVGVGGLPHA